MGQPERVCIVAKTKRRTGACVGGITTSGQSVRLEHPSGPFAPENLDFEVGDVWEIECAPKQDLQPPHMETVVYDSSKLARRNIPGLIPIIERFMPSVCGSVDQLYDGLLRQTEHGSLYLCTEGGVPTYSTLFWRPDTPLIRDSSGPTLRYRAGSHHTSPSLAYTGFLPPVPVIDAGTLLRVSLAHWWRPEDQPEQELRCYAQLSGWFGIEETEPYKVFSNGVPEPPQLPTAPDPLSTLQTVFGYDEFLPLQQEAIDTLLAGQDALVVLPTGSGKSLCYQLPALLFEGLTVVISPLIALMQDQVDQLHQLGIPATTLNSTLDSATFAHNRNLVQTGAVKLLYLAPERLQDYSTLMLLAQARVQAFAVDEAHCISGWGHDFRAEYRQLEETRKIFPHTPWLALTATATPRVQDDIQASLGMAQSVKLVGAFDRPNLFLRAEPRTDEMKQIVEMIEAHPQQSGIVYCRTRKKVDAMAANLAARGIQAAPYHAGMPDAERTQNQRRFIRDEIHVIVATIAFGMGINKPDVRFVIHADPPDSMEAYYQQVGRAGRDGSRSDCLLLYSQADFKRMRNLTQNGQGENTEAKLAQLDKLMAWVQTTTCRRTGLLAYFGEPAPPESCAMCDGCIVEIGEDELTEPAQTILACIEQTNESFGATYIIDILRGSKNKKILQNRHDQLLTYGKGQNYTKGAWQELIDQFLRLGLLMRGGYQNLVLNITGKGRDVMKQGSAVYGRLPQNVVPPAAGTTTGVSPAAHPELFDRLKTLRRTLADEAGLPAYVIFPDRTLQEMATYLPQNPVALGEIHGVGERRLANYGEQFLQVIDQYCRENNITHDQPLKPASIQTQPAQSPHTGQARYMWVAEQFCAGASTTDIAATLSVKRETIVKHLRSYIEEEHSLPVDKLLAESHLSHNERNAVFAQFKVDASLRLTPIYEHFAGNVSYIELHILRLAYLLQQRAQPQNDPARESEPDIDELWD